MAKCASCNQEVQRSGSIASGSEEDYPGRLPMPGVQT